MTSKEAFEQFKDCFGWYPCASDSMWKAYLAGRNDQKQKDAEIADGLWCWSSDPYMQSYDKDVGDEIRNQGDE